MPGFLKQSTASQSRAIGPFLDDTDFKTAETGLTIANTDIKLVVNGGASANKNSGGGTHRVNGVYGVTFDATDTATVGEMQVSVVVSGALPVFDKFIVVEEAVYDALFGASALGYVAGATVDVTSISGDSTAADRLEQALDDTAGAVPWIGIVDQGTAQSATGTTLVLRSAAAFADDELIGCTIVITGGSAGVGQARVITDYVGSTDTATVDTWTTTPSGTITYKIFASAPSSTSVPPAVNLTQIAGSTVSTSSAQLGVNVVQAAGTAWGSGAITAASIAADAITAAKVADGTIDANTFASGAITAAAIAADAIGASELAADAVAEIADGVWDEAMSGHTTAGTYGQRLVPLRTGTAQGGANGSITLDASASAVDDFYKNALVVVTGGTGANQARTISGYTGATKVATVTPNWGTNPDNTSVFILLPAGAIAGATAPTAGEVADAVWDEARSGHTTAGSFGEYVLADTKLISGDAIAADNAESFFDGTGYAGTNNVIPTVTAVTTVNGLAANTITATSIAANAITAAKIATDAIDADAIAADAVTEIQSGLATASSLSTVNTTVNAILAMLDDPRAEPGQGAPAVNADMATKVDYIYKFLRNKVTQTATTFSVFADDGTTVDHKATVSDNGTTYTRGEIATGP